MYHFWKKGQAIWKDFKDLEMFMQGKKQKGQSSDGTLSAAIKDNQKWSYESATQGGLRRLSSLYWMQKETE